MAEYFEEVKRFLAILISGFSEAEYGFIPFSTTVVDASVVHLGEYNTYPQNYINLMDMSIDGKYQRTDTFRAIEYARNHFDSIPKYTDDSEREKVMVLITDGKSTDRNATVEEANLARNDNIKIIGMGVGNYDNDELSLVADEGNVFSYTDDATTNTVMLHQLHAKMCQIILPGDCNAGSYRMGSECRPCELGYYQPLDEQTSCKKCPDDTSTSDVGSNNELDCVSSNICNPGQYYVSPDGCQPCPVNTYKSTTGDGPCIDCPAAKPKTMATGAKSEDECTADKCMVKMDLVFVIDASASIDFTDYTFLKIFLINLLLDSSKFDLDATETRVAITTIGSDTTEEDFIDFVSETDQLRTSISGLRSGQPTTNTASALEMVTSKVAPGVRLDDTVPVVVVVITDGNSNNPYETLLQASFLDQYATIIAFGVGDRVFQQELSNIASKSDDGYVLQIADFKLISSVDLTGTICRAAEDWTQFVPPVDTSCELPLDLVFVMDLSYSVSGNSFMLKLNLQQAIDALPIDEDGVHVGIVSYGQSLNTDNKEPLTYDTVALKSAIVNQPADTQPGGTVTDEAILEANNILVGGRPNAFRMMMVFTDGASTYPDRTKDAADNARSNNIYLIAFGPQNAVQSNKDELDYMSSSGEAIYIETGYINVQAEDIEQAACAGKTVCHHPMDVVFIWYIADSNLQPQVTTLTSAITSRFTQMTASLIQVVPGTSIDDLQKALIEAKTKSLKSTDMRQVVVITDQDPDPVDEPDLTNAVDDLKSSGVIVSFIENEGSTRPWIPYASSSTFHYTNEEFTDDTVTTQIAWNLCKKSCNSGYDIDEMGHCHVCPIGSYRDNTETYQCVECGSSDKWTTEGTGKTSSDDCRLIEDECIGGFEKAADGTCVPCPINEYRQRYRQLECTPCPYDFFTPYIGSTECLPPCDRGEYWSDEDEACLPCPEGSYNDDPYQFICKECDGEEMVTVDLDTRGIVSGATSEEQCMKDCELGTQWNGLYCQECGAGFFQDQPRRDYCAACNQGYTSDPGSTSQTDCSDPCESGYTYNPDQALCEPCGEDMYRNKDSGDNICLDCPVGLGTGAVDNATSVDQCISDCEAGEMWDSDLHNCFKCPSGTYQPKPGSLTCLDCREGWVSQTGSTSESDCKPPCVKGEEWDETNDKCVPCGLGKYQDEDNQESCNSCPSSTSTIGTGATDSSDCSSSCDGDRWLCTASQTCRPGNKRCDGVDNCPDTSDELGCDCPAGTIYDQASSTCNECPVGYFQELAGQLRCIQCPIGKTTPNPGSSSGGDCEDMCDSGERFDTVQNGCVACDDGEYRMKNRDDPTQCIPCPDPFTTKPGEPKGDKTTCVPYCAGGGQHYDVTDKTCKPCGTGYYQPEEYGEIECVKCQPGTTTTGTSSTSAADCTEECPAGQELPLSSGTSTADCVDCTEGSYRDNTMSLCGSCAPGLTSPVGSDNVDDCYPDCEIGQEFNAASADGCQDCSIGSYKSSKPTPDDPFCTACPDGKSTNYTASTSADECIDVCNSGLQVSPDKSECLICPKGTYKEKGVNDLCTECPDHYSTPSAGSSSIDNCTVCRAGYKKTASSDDCVACGFDFYRTDYGNDEECIPCANGKLTYTRNATSSSQCYDECSPGQFLNEVTGVCESCSSTEYQDEPGQKECKPCPKNYHNNGVDMSSVEHCRADWCDDGMKLVYIDGNKECVPCGYGFFRGRDDPECIPCPNGHVTTVDTATLPSQCHACGPGFKIVDGVCQPCGIGFYSNQVSDSCNECPAGTTTQTSVSTSQDDCHEKCSKGYYFDLDEDRCEKCLISHYQDKIGQFECIPCEEIGENYHTNGVNQSRARDCKADWCDAGYKLVGGDPPIGKCVPCGYGFYRGDDDGECLPCPAGKTTTVDTAKTSSECVADPCSSGYESVDMVCVKCNHGFYKEQGVSIRCVACPGGNTTAETGATSADMCVVPSCESGYEISNGQCVPCQYGFYRTNGVHGQCVACPDDHTTHRRGATSANMCIMIGHRCSIKFDLIITVDLSRPSCNDELVRYLKQWLMDLIYRLDVHRNKVRVGIIRYGSGTSALVDLRGGVYNKRLCSLINRGLRCSPKVKANTHLALRNADYMFRQQSYGCPKQVLLVTANCEPCLKSEVAAANALKSQGIHMTVLSPDHRVVEQLASDTESQFVITNYRNLPSPQDVIRSLCRT